MLHADPCDSAAFAALAPNRGADSTARHRIPVRPWCVLRTQAPAPAACGVSLVSQHSFARCALGSSFGCVNATHVFVRGCRGLFRCDGGADGFACGYPPGRKEYECGCDGRADDLPEDDTLPECTVYSSASQAPSRRHAAPGPHRHHGPPREDRQTERESEGEAGRAVSQGRPTRDTPHAQHHAARRIGRPVEEAVPAGVSPHISPYHTISPHISLKPLSVGSQSFDSDDGFGL